LTGGIKVIGTENTELPTVTLSIRIPGGHLAQAGNLSKAGLSSFFTSMLSQDTKQRSAEDFAKELQKLGSSIDVYSGTDEITVDVFALKKNLDATLALVEERLLSPKFTADAFNRLKRQRIESFKQSKSQPAAIASSVFSMVNYGKNSIFGISQNGTEETIGNMTLEDIQGYYDNNITTDGMNVVVVGDVKEDEVLPKLSFLNKLPNKKIAAPVIPAFKPAEKTKFTW